MSYTKPEAMNYELMQAALKVGLDYRAATARLARAAHTGARRELSARVRALRMLFLHLIAEASLNLRSSRST